MQNNVRVIVEIDGEPQYSYFKKLVTLVELTL